MDVIDAFDSSAGEDSIGSSNEPCLCAPITNADKKKEREERKEKFISNNHTTISMYVYLEVMIIWLEERKKEKTFWGFNLFGREKDLIDYV